MAGRGETAVLKRIVGGAFFLLGLMAKPSSEPMNSFDPALRDLLQALQTETEFSNITGRFLDLVESTDFVSHCNRRSNEMVEKLVAEALKSKLRIETPPEGILMLHYPKFDFFHGSGMLAPRFFQVFYFRREKIGLLSVVGPGGEMDYIRISVAGESAAPSLN
jgi:hypothetical protein